MIINNKVAAISHLNSGLITVKTRMICLIWKLSLLRIYAMVINASVSTRLIIVSVSKIRLVKLVLSILRATIHLLTAPQILEVDQREALKTS